MRILLAVPDRAVGVLPGCLEEDRGGMVAEVMDSCRECGSRRNEEADGKSVSCSVLSSSVEEGEESTLGRVAKADSDVPCNQSLCS